MTDQVPRGLGLIGTALLLGLLGNALFKVQPGINFFLWLSIAVSAGWALIPDDRQPRYWPFGAALIFAFFIALRASEFLTFWNVVAILGLVTLPVLELQEIRLATARVTQMIHGALTTLRHTVTGLLTPLQGDAAWGGLSLFRGSAGSIAIGIALAVPTLLVFGGLLVQADRGFDRIVSTMIFFDLEDFVQNAFVIAFITWCVAGYLAPFLTRPDPRDPLDIPRPQLGIVEVATPLLAVVVLFTAYVLLQLGYLFGGEAAMRAAGLTYAEYAREGFEELVVASALVLPLVLGANWWFQKRSARDTRVFNLIGTTLVVLCLLMLVSALHRDALYVGQYGLTEVRLYAAVFLVWVGIVHVTLASTVLRNRPDRFVSRALVAGLLVLGLLNLSNPEAIIARSQMARARAGAELDHSYLTTLSDDAAHVIAANLNGLDVTTACALYDSEIRPTGQELDWRSWNLGRRRRAAAVTRYELNTWVSCPAAPSVVQASNVNGGEAGPS